ncbi:MAG TPA: SCO family protein [Steroidobacteraceae bacterium]|nr:SCO family protein [Steroidobacteraceae bacterium]
MANRSGMAVGLAVAIAAGIGAALWLRDKPLALDAGTVLPEPHPVAAFELVDHEGRAFDRQALAGRWSLVFAGFTHCPDICPMTLATLGELGRRLGAASPRLVFVSVDPERDTPARISAYLRHFGPDLVGATGSPAAIGSFMRDLGLAQVKVPGVGGDYTVDHSAALVLLDPQARVAGYFTPPHDIGLLAADLAGLDGRKR